MKWSWRKGMGVFHRHPAQPVKTVRPLDLRATLQLSKEEKEKDEAKKILHA